MSRYSIITILIATRHYGAGTTPDSAGYIAAARNIATGNGVIIYDGTPLVVQPPLYSALLATVDFVFGVHPLASASIVNAFLYGLIVFLAGLLARKYLQPSVFAILGATSVVVAIPLIQVSLMVWTELLFICFALLYLIFFEAYRAKGDVTSLLFLSFFVALACLTRYIGVIFILVGIVSILLFRTNSLRITFQHLLIFVSIAALPIGMWTIRNYFVSGTLLGPRTSSTHSLFQNITFVFNSVFSWYIPQITFKYGLGIILLSASIGFLAYLAVRGGRSKARTVLLEIGPLLVFTLIYIGFLVISSTTTAFDPIDNRLLSPVFIPVNLLFLLLYCQLVMSFAQQRLPRKGATAFLALAIALWLAYPTVTANVTVLNAMNKGLVYTSVSWRNSQTIEYISQNKGLESECEIYTNGPDVLYILTNVQAKASLRKYDSPELINNIANLRGSWPGESNSCLIWFTKIGRPYLFTVEELETIATLQPIMRLEDGAVYSVTRK